MIVLLKVTTLILVLSMGATALAQCQGGSCGVRKGAKRAPVRSILSALRGK